MPSFYDWEDSEPVNHADRRYVQGLKRETRRWKDLLHEVYVALALTDIDSEGRIDRAKQLIEKGLDK